VVAELSTRGKAWPLRGAIVLLAVAAVFAGWAGWSWLRTSGDDSLELAAARDAALRAGRQHVVELTTLDYHDVDAGIAHWLAVSTGPLREQLAATTEQTKNSLRQGATVATGAVLGAAVSELDPRAGTAKLLVSVEITTAKQGVPTSSRRNRFIAALTRVDAEWKVSALDQVPTDSR
jgi:Mce-associated membrane protein